MPGPAGAAAAAAGHLWGRVDAGADAAEGRGHGGGGEVRHDRLGDRRVLRHLHQPLPVIPGRAVRVTRSLPSPPGSRRKLAGSRTRTAIRVRARTPPHAGPFGPLTEPLTGSAIRISAPRNRASRARLSESGPVAHAARYADGPIGALSVQPRRRGGSPSRTWSSSANSSSSPPGPPPSSGPPPPSRCRAAGLAGKSDLMTRLHPNAPPAQPRGPRLATLWSGGPGHPQHPGSNFDPSL